MFQMTPVMAAVFGYGLVYSYTPGFPIFGNSNVQLADFRAGLWYAQFTFGSVTYTGRLLWPADTTPPLIRRIIASPNVLWPPNHRMVPIQLTVDVIDDQDPAPVAHIVGVASNEPENPFQPEVEMTGPLSLNLRSERLARGDGRIYTITIECQDATGNVSSASVEVRVPHD
jgi:hypothetical protein